MVALFPIIQCHEAKEFVYRCRRRLGRNGLRLSLSSEPDPFRMFHACYMEPDRQTSRESMIPLCSFGKMLLRAQIPFPHERCMMMMMMMLIELQVAKLNCLGRYTRWPFVGDPIRLN